MGGPVTWTLTALAGIVLVFIGREAAMAKMLRANIYQWVRELKSEKSLRDKLTSETTKFETQLANAFAAEFSSNAGADMAARISAAVEDQLRQRADRAELLIY